MRSRGVLTGVAVSVMLLLAGASVCEFLCRCDHEAAIKEVVSGCHQQEAGPEASRRIATHSDTHADCDCCSRTCLKDSDATMNKPVYLAAASQYSLSHGMVPTEDVEILSSGIEPSARNIRLPSDNRGSPAYILNSSLLF